MFRVTARAQLSLLNKKSAVHAGWATVTLSAQRRGERRHVEAASCERVVTNGGPYGSDYDGATKKTNNTIFSQLFLLTLVT